MLLSLVNTTISPVLCTPLCCAPLRLVKMTEFQVNLLGQVKASTNCNVTKSVLDTVYDPTTGTVCNEWWIRPNIKVPQLSKTIQTINDFIRHRFVGRSFLQADTRDTKKQLAAKITNFFTIKVNDCGVCSLSIEELALNPSVFVFCVACGAPAHSNCYPQIDYSQGIVYCCTICVGRLISLPAALVPPPDPLSTDSQQLLGDGNTSAVFSLSQDVVQAGDVTGAGGMPDGVPSGGNTDPQIRTSHPGNQGPSRRNGYDRSVTVCKFLKKGICRHGISGKNCVHYHPPYCRNFQKWGEDNTLGCQKGSQCKFYHPELCPAKASGRRCETQGCKLHHIKSRRSAIRNQTRNANPNREVPPISPNAPTLPNTLSSDNSNSAQDFLKLIQALQNASKIFSALGPMLSSASSQLELNNLLPQSQ